MDTEALKRRITQELNDQFEGKLREARREKTEMEEEMESASERWRVERRRLNSEIDRLEAALTEAKAAAAKKPAEAKVETEDKSAELAGMLAAADERLAVASKEWEVERDRFVSEISRLQESVTDILERSNNPVRSLHAVQQKLEAQLQDAGGAKARVEAEFARAKAAWEQERVKMAGELFRLRRGGSATDDSGAGDEQTRQARAEIVRLERQLAEVQEAANTERNAGEKANRNTKARQAEFAAEREALTAKLEQSGALLAEEKQRSAGLGEELRKAQDEIRRLESRPTGAREAGQSHATQYPADMEALAREKATVESKLQSANALLALERQRAAASSGELKQARERAERLEQEMAKGGGAPGGTEAFRAEMEEKLRGLEGEKNALTERLKNVTATLAEEKKRADSVTEELSRTRNKAQRGEKKAAKDDDSGADAVQRLSDQHAAQMRELSEQNNALAGQLEEAGQILEMERHRAAVAEEELVRARTETEQLERRLAESGDTVSGDVVEQLRAQYAAKLEAIAQEKTELAGRLESASALLEQERSRFANAAGAPNAVDRSVIDEEVSRVESAIAEITQFIDDPAAQLAAVIRKNVERAELDAYLRGILFARGEVRPAE
jgi:chromosome segregation ATPase